jgi:tRNA (guanine37-N1)-methyltransferase
MNITVLTLFPEMVEPFFTNSIMKRAVEQGIITYTIVNFREFAEGKHKSCDDVPFGGTAGMLLKCGPIDKALEAIGTEGKRVVFATPSGKRFDQKYALDLSKEKDLIFICGHYEGLDQRVIDRWVDDEVSVGDYVISSGEVATLVIIDALYRLVDGVIAADSLDEESFHGGLLEYPQYTRPETYCSNVVPAVLLSGHHAHICEWHVMQRLERTLERRPELLETADLDGASRIMLNKLLVHDCEKGL